MPYASIEDLPDSVRGHLPEHAAEIYRSAFNHAWVSYADRLDREEIALRLVPGADVHLMPGLVEGLQSGRILSLADSRYVLLEPPDRVPPARLADQFFGLMLEGYHPILTHPERLGWVSLHYALIDHLAQAGVWMQVTAS